MFHKKNILIPILIFILIAALFILPRGIKPSFEDPTKKYSPVDLTGVSFPLKRIEVKDGTPSITEAVGTIIYEDELFCAKDITSFAWVIEENAPELSHFLRETAVCVSQFNATGYHSTYLLYYYHLYYLVAEKDGEAFVLPCLGRTEESSFFDWGYHFVDPMKLSDFLHMIERYQSDPENASASGGWGYY